MHDSVREFAARVLDPSWVEGARVLEVGSLDVNGSLRELVMSLGASEYIGTDMQEGPGVDRVVSASHLDYDREFDLVICTEMLEHAEHWQSDLYAIKRALRIEGHLLLTTRGPGAARHAYPDDFWRFTLRNIDDAFPDFSVIALERDEQMPGVLFCGTRIMRTAVRPSFSVEEAPAA